MPKVVKGNDFHSNFLKRVSRAPYKRAVDGAVVRTDGISDEIAKMHKTIGKNGYLPNDKYQPINNAQLSLMCLYSMGITVQILEKEHPMTFMETYKSQNYQNKGDELNEGSRKNYGDFSFPDRNDPFYEMDETLPEYLLKKEKQIKSSHDFRSITEFSARIGRANHRLPALRKLKQFVE